MDKKKSPQESPTPPQGPSPKPSFVEILNEHWLLCCVVLVILGMIIMSTTLNYLGIGLLALGVLGYLIKALPTGIKSWVWEIKGLSEIRKQAERSKNIPPKNG
jgi:hypothetical protein